MVAAIIQKLPKYKDIGELKALQFPIQTMVRHRNPSLAQPLASHMTACLLSIASCAQYFRMVGKEALNSTIMWQTLFKMSYICRVLSQDLRAMRYVFACIQGLALFLLLAFRTNSSYDRWWEGRKLWDAINAKVQDMTRMAIGTPSANQAHN